MTKTGLLYPKPETAIQTYVMAGINYSYTVNYRISIGMNYSILPNAFTK